MPKHLAEQWLLVRSNSFRLPGSGEVPGVVRGRWEVGYVGLPATGKLRVDGGSGISRDCRAESVGFNVGGIDQSNFDPERGTVKGISKAVILMPEVSGIEVVPDPFSEAGRELFFLAFSWRKRASWMPRGFSLNENFWFISIQLSTSHWACSPFGKARLKSAVFFFRFLLCSARSSGAADLC